MKPFVVDQKQVSVSDFKAHCTEYLRAVESGEAEFTITKHGKVIAIAKAPELAIPEKSLLGAGKDSAVLNPSYDPHAPAISVEDWEMND